MRGRYARWCVVLLVATVLFANVVCAEEYEGTLDANNPSLVFTVPAQNGQLVTIQPVIEPRSIGGEYHLRLEKEEGIVIREWSGSVSRLRFKTDSDKIMMEYSPIKLDGSFRVIITSSDSATIKVAIDRADAYDLNGSTDADADVSDSSKIGTGLTSGHIAGSRERESISDDLGIPFKDSLAYVDDTDWYELVAPAEGKKYFMDLGPQARGLYAIRVITPDGQPIYNQSAIYPFEHLQFTLQDQGYGRFFIEISSPNASGGGYYSLDITEHDLDEPIETIAHARSVLISPLSTIATEENPWNRFWHIMIIAILGMMVVAMVSAYHFGKRVPAHKTARSTSDYIKQALEAGYTSEQIETSLRAYGYSDTLIKQGFEKIQ